ncbi:glycoside hydrolase family 26 protein [Kineosporia succinea]|uniref:GH26 domain-containing protein n=1 Tax=Kineosporia succinea TaxID=84632 RepID=A0ABT9PFM1_9ACTN|nr:glycosyl hydrolase [Kineosporia succinea]MDP9830970.1 hypothetical protein [Kineosporia succinea]
MSWNDHADGEPRETGRGLKTQEYGSWADIDSVTRSSQDPQTRATAPKRRRRRLQDQPGHQFRGRGRPARRGFRLTTRQSVALVALLASLTLIVVGTVRQSQHERQTPQAGTVSAAGQSDALQRPLDGRLGLFSGTDLKATQTFEKWLGRDLTFATVFGERATWSDIADPGRNVTMWKDSGYRIVMAVPMLPDTMAATKVAAMEQGAQGKFNDQFVQLAETLVENGQSKAVLRVGWEFNLKSWTWGIDDPGTFIAFYRQIVDAMRSVDGQQFEFDWNPNNGFNPYDAKDYYPGGEYVDYVGVDVYDLHSGIYPYPRNCDDSCREDLQSRAWKENIYGGPRGLEFWTNFAKQQGKPVSLPEWGLWDVYADHSGGADNPQFIKYMHDYITWAPNNVAYADYFNLNSEYGEHSLTTSFPDSRKQFLKLFGG